MNPNYNRVLSAVRQVSKEAEKWHSKDGETLDKWSERRLTMAAERLTELLFTYETTKQSSCEK